MRPRTWLAALVVLVVAAPAAAEDDLAKADVLFQEAGRLFPTNPKRACELYDEAAALNPHATGMLLNVGRCRELEGRVSSAVDAYKEALRLARETNLACDDCAKKEQALAERQVALLIGDVPHLTVVFAETLPDMKIVIANKLAPLDKLDKLAVDPGNVAISVSAPGRVTYETHIEIKKHDDKRVEIPSLGRSVDTSRALVGKITVIAGGATFVAGVVLGFVAKGRYDEVFDSHQCSRDSLVCVDAVADQKVKSARTLGTAGTVVGIVGLAAAAAGVVMWVTAPKPATEVRVSLLPQVGPDGVGVFAVGRF